MKKIFWLLTFLLISLTSCSQNDTILNVLKSQVEAFNSQDVDKLVANVSDDIKYFYITPDQLLQEVEGKENFRKSMQAYFDSGIKVFSKIEDYVIEGNRISFKEVVSYTNKKGKKVSASSLGVYQIVNGKITRTWYFTD